jgi:hypothetical protein
MAILAPINSFPFWIGNWGFAYLADLIISGYSSLRAGINFPGDTANRETSPPE